MRVIDVRNGNKFEMYEALTATLLKEERLLVRLYKIGGSEDVEVTSREKFDAWFDEYMRNRSKYMRRVFIAETGWNSGEVRMYRNHEIMQQSDEPILWMPKFATGVLRQTADGQIVRMITRDNIKRTLDPARVNALCAAFSSENHTMTPERLAELYA